MIDPDIVERATRVVLWKLHPEGCNQSLAENGFVVVPPHLYAQAKQVARAVIASIREPTEAMWLAPPQADISVSGIYPSGEECERIWQAMIDAALAE